MTVNDRDGGFAELSGGSRIQAVQPIQERLTVFLQLVAPDALHAGHRVECSFSSPPGYLRGSEPKLCYHLHALFFEHWLL